MIQRFIFSLFISGLVFIISCSKKDEVKPIIITASDFSASIDENPTNGQVIGKVQASASDNSALTYTLSSQNVSGAISIDGNTGEIRVADVAAFDFEINTSISGKVNVVADEMTEKEINLQITIKDVVETVITANDFSVNIDENPANGDEIGRVQASIDNNAALTYVLSNQSVAGAMTIDANTGKLTVADATAFDFETNTRITADYTASEGTQTATGNIVITIKDVAETVITANDFSVSINENPANGDLIGTVQASANDNSTLTYALNNQSISGAMAIDINTGKLSVADAATFDFETNPRITASYTASVGTKTVTGNITITIQDVASELRVGENGLIAHYTFDNTLADAMGNFPNMVFEGSSIFNPTAELDRKGGSNKAYGLSNMTKYIKLANQDALVDNDKTFTISIWVYPQGGRQVLQPVIYKEFDYELQVSPGIFINPRTYFSSVKHGTPSDTDAWGTVATARQLRSAPRLQRWSHIALVCENNKVRLYVNGVEVDAQDNTAPSFKNSGKDIYIGAILDASGALSNKYVGRVDDFRYYKQALTVTQIQALANDK